MSTIADTFTSSPAPDAAPGVVVAADSLVAVVEAVEHLGSCSTDYDALSDTELLAGHFSRGCQANRRPQVADRRRGARDGQAVASLHDSIDKPLAVPWTGFCVDDPNVNVVSLVRRGVPAYRGRRGWLAVGRERPG